MSAGPRDVAVLGLGQMGGGIARHLDEAGFLGATWDPREAARAPYEGRNDVAVGAPATIAASCSRFVFVVPSTHEIEECLTGPGAMLDQIRPGSVIFDLTTSDPGESGRLAALAAERGVAYLDCGMTGGAAGADAGTLTLMVGGEKALLDEARPMLETFAERIFHVGPQGSGHALKLIHNMVLHTMFLANCEGVRAAGRFGIDAGTVIDVFNAGNARSYSSEVRFPRHILSGTFDARSRIANLEKDVRMAAEMSDRLGAPTPFGHMAAALLGRAVDAGMADTDFSRLYEVFDELAGT